MKTLHSILLGFGLAICAASANALSFNWSFQDQVTQGYVTGRIDGLQEGQNNGNAVTITVYSTPEGPCCTNYQWVQTLFDNQHTRNKGFTVTNGEITMASEWYSPLGSQFPYLFLVLNPPNIPYAWFTEFLDSPHNKRFYDFPYNGSNSGQTLSFSAIDEPPAIMLIGIGLLGLKLSKRK